MAEVTPTFTLRNKVGDRNEDYGYFTVPGGGAGHVVCRMSSLDEVEMETPNEATSPDKSALLYLNAATTTEGGTPGAFYFSNLTATQVVYFRAVGRG